MEALKEPLKKLSDDKDTDIYLFSAGVDDSSADAFVNLVRDHKNKKKNCSLFLTTLGGDPDAGYRMVRIIRRYYEQFFLYVLGRCKSTGTLIALGADEIIMGDFGEFGPLDIQLTKDDEMSNTSGLSYLQSLTSLNEQIFRSFEVNFLNLKRRSGYSITTKTAGEISSKLAVGLISPISAQIDPVKLGEVQRAIKIADAYGQRLCEKSDLVARLIVGYPSHGFVIDFEEAQKIFGNVRWVENVEIELEKLLFPIVRNEGDNMINDLSGNFLKDSTLEKTGNIETVQNNDNLEPAKGPDTSESEQPKTSTNGTNGAKAKEAKKV